jgi:hypothetical protein
MHGPHEMQDLRLLLGRRAMNSPHRARNRRFSRNDGDAIKVTSLKRSARTGRSRSAVVGGARVVND